MGQDKSRIIDLFRSFDANGDGTLSRREFAAGLRASGFELTKEVNTFAISLLFNIVIGTRHPDAAR